MLTTLGHILDMADCQQLKTPDKPTIVKAFRRSICLGLFLM
ncbi:hypothetical protein LC2W_2412 [Lacticaseibacillus paracasei]|nr:hypothetical protein LCAZH_2221 [Lacticaseibacillus paracasei]AEA54743.1 hypothetical protein LC2W_2412 [Lacticaseibacillus paracasei]AEA57925.1 hypothetical protein LCBD_2430 [Lacticaseibacillus paracasei]